jgi:tetratricopeptide (TPR) repeat protein
MKKYFCSTLLLLFINAALLAQVAKNPKTQKPSSPAQLNEAMEKAMEKMTPQQKEQMKKMMGNVMPAMLENTSDYHYSEITNNRELLYKNDVVRINAMPKKKLTQADIPGYANNLFSKIMAKGDAAEIAIIKNVIAKGNDAAHFGNAAIVCMLQGHPQAAMGLSIKAVQTDPTNANGQNNMASLLTQYGYAEQAIPVLQKLRNDFNDNSTVLNNLAQAWFSLGQLDSAKTLAFAASKTNPLHPDAQVCGGVIEEAEGNAEKAIEHYTRALEQSPDPFTEKLLKNSSGQNALNNIDFDKLKQNITIYAYFPKDWIQLPELSNNVAGYENDRATKNGYSKIFQALHKEVQKMLTLSQSEVNASLKKGKEAFATDMMQEMMKHGNSFISKPAGIITSLITIKLSKLSQEYAREKQKIDELIDAKIQEKNAAGKNDDCEAADRRNNEFLATVNPMLRKFYIKYFEEFRIWINAYCTWIWYLTGNIKNTSLSFCLNYTQFYANLFRDAIESLETAFPRCQEGINGSRENNTPLPKIPSFNCPTVVAVPVGLDWHALDNSPKNFDANSSNIKKAAGTPVPNITIAYGPGGNNIAQPGQMPFTKTANGSILPAYGGALLPEYATKVTDKEVNAVIDKKLSELLKKTLQEQGSHDAKKELNTAIDKKLSELLKKTLQKKLQGMMLSDCNELESLKESDKKKFWEEKKRKAEAKIEREEEFKKWEEILKSDEFKQWDENQKKWANDIIKRYQEAERKVKDWIAGKGPHPSLSSSVQAPTTTTPQGLFK